MQRSLSLLQASCKQQWALRSSLQAPRNSQQQQNQQVTPPERVQQALKQQALPAVYLLCWLAATSQVLL
jgi:hypothetical protein